VKIVLREEVENLGRRGQVVNVAAGYARNYLLPKGLALEATPGNLKVLEQQRRVWALRESQEIEAARALAGQLAALELSCVKKAGESGTLYGSVTSTEIAELLAQKGIEVDRRRIVLDESIKTVGTHDVSIKLHREVVGRFKVEVVGEEATE